YVPGHICTGPIRVKGARPGMILKVEILDVRLNSDWAYNVIMPGLGALQDKTIDERVIYLDIDAENGTIRTPWGQVLRAKPFFGLLTVAPPPALGSVSTVSPLRTGGNMDNKELVAGSTLYLPIAVDGALFSVGDGHALQG